MSGRIVKHCFLSRIFREYARRHVLTFNVIHSDVYARHTNLQTRKHANYTINSHLFIFIPVDSQGCCHCYLKLESAGTQSRT